MSHAYDVLIEGEFGSVGSPESGETGEEGEVCVAGTLTPAQMLTDPVEAKLFVAEPVSMPWPLLEPLVTELTNSRDRPRATY